MSYGRLCAVLLAQLACRCLRCPPFFVLFLPLRRRWFASWRLTDWIEVNICCQSAVVAPLLGLGSILAPATIYTDFAPGTGYTRVVVPNAHVLSPHYIVLFSAFFSCARPSSVEHVCCACRTHTHPKTHHFPRCVCCWFYFICWCHGFSFLCHQRVRGEIDGSGRGR